jgi:hypothetical protein
VFVARIVKSLRFGQSSNFEIFTHGESQAAGLSNRALAWGRLRSQMSCAYGREGSRLSALAVTTAALHRPIWAKGAPNFLQTVQARRLYSILDYSRPCEDSSGLDTKPRGAPGGLPQNDLRLI